MPDIFDTLLNKVAEVLVPKTGEDELGQPPLGFDTVATGVPVRLSVLGGGRERKTPDQAVVMYTKVFMRPRAITEANWLRVDGALYNITDVQNPGGMDHHYELICEEVKPSGVYEGS